MENGRIWSKEEEVRGRGEEYRVKRMKRERDRRWSKENEVKGRGEEDVVKRKR